MYLRHSQQNFRDFTVRWNFATHRLFESEMSSQSISALAQLEHRGCPLSHLTLRCLHLRQATVLRCIIRA